jgi:hypothetical protein
VARGEKPLPEGLWHGASEFPKSVKSVLSLRISLVFWHRISEIGILVLDFPTGKAMLRLLERGVAAKTKNEGVKN